MNLPMKLRPTLLPTLADEQRMIDTVAGWIKQARQELWSKKYSQEFFVAVMLKRFREGCPLALAEAAVDLANAGDPFADRALRAFFQEMLGGMHPERGPGHLQILAYGQRAVGRDLHKRRGRRWQERWIRDFLICRLIVTTYRKFNLWPTRNQITYRRNRHERRAERRAQLARLARRAGHPVNRPEPRANQTPSGISIVVAAWNRTHHPLLDEGSVQQNIWFRLPGEIVRDMGDAALLRLPQEA